MKYLKLITSGLGLALSLSLATPALAVESNWNNWTQSYYRAPQPDQLVSEVFAASRSGALDKEELVSTNIGFLSAVFAHNPERVDGWMREFDRLPLGHRRLVAAARWYSALPGGDKELRLLAKDATPATERELNQLLKIPPVPVANTPVLSEGSLNLLWGAFLASGEAKYIVNALSALGSDQAGLSSAARYSLAQKAATHERVFAICQDEISRQPAGVRDGLQAALADARSQR